MTDFCKECKAQLEGHGRYCTRCGADNGEVTKEKCSVCDCPYDSNARYCSRDGYNLRKYQDERRNFDEFSRRCGIAFLFVVGWIFIASGVSLYFHNINGIFWNWIPHIVLGIVFTVLLVKKFIKRDDTFREKLDSLKINSKTGKEI